MTIGIDEVGRGPLAGPVMVCALALLDTGKNKNAQCAIKEVKDSKQLTDAQREWWFAWISNNPTIKYAIAWCGPKTIDRINITKAANRAAHRAYKKLCSRIHQNPMSILYRSETSILLDGGLQLPKHIPHRTIVKADEKYPAVACASIIAKVTRDRYMTRQHKKYPYYQFREHKGYGTAAHIQALKRHGLCPLHRLTFLKKYRYTIDNQTSEI